MPLLSAYFQGFALCVGLIVAIGAQNAFVLRQGLRGEHVLLIASVCFVSDALLISLGCLGFGTLVNTQPLLLAAVRYLGAAFLIVYGLRSARAALRPGALEAQGGERLSSRQALLSVLALTWLNPHVYLDTVLLIGGLAGRYAPSLRAAFALGAITVSALWFYGLAYGAAALAPLFRRPATWRLLDLLIAVTMISIALALLFGR